jgi:hypothetical protein
MINIIVGTEIKRRIRDMKSIILNSKIGIKYTELNRLLVLELNVGIGRKDEHSNQAMNVSPGTENQTGYEF